MLFEPALAKKRFGVNHPGRKAIKKKQNRLKTTRKIIADSALCRLSQRPKRSLLFDLKLAGVIILGYVLSFSMSR